MGENGESGSVGVDRCSSVGLLDLSFIVRQPLHWGIVGDCWCFGLSMWESAVTRLRAFYP